LIGFVAQGFHPTRRILFVEARHGTMDGVCQLEGAGEPDYGQCPWLSFHPMILDCGVIIIQFVVYICLLRQESEILGFCSLFRAGGEEFSVEVHHGGFFCGSSYNRVYFECKVDVFDYCKGQY
jgi:hypothetical protein